MKNKDLAIIILLWFVFLIFISTLFGGWFLGSENSTLLRLIESTRGTSWLRAGFWAMGLGFFILPSSLLGNLIFSIIIFIKKERKTKIKPIFILSLLSSLIGVSIWEGHILILNFRNWSNIFTEFFGTLVPYFLWVTYFIFISQFLTSFFVEKLISNKKLHKLFGYNLFFIIFRLILIFALTLAIIFLHMWIGTDLIGVTWD